jgi:hypothetical protein
MTTSKTEDGPEPFDSWNARFEAWLASLAPNDPVLRMDEFDQCAAFEIREQSARSGGGQS